MRNSGLHRSGRTTQGGEAEEMTGASGEEVVFKREDPSVAVVASAENNPSRLKKSLKKNSHPSEACTCHLFLPKNFYFH